jgi:hypothetical protein
MSADPVLAAILRLLDALTTAAKVAATVVVAISFSAVRRVSVLLMV